LAARKPCEPQLALMAAVVAAERAAPGSTHVHTAFLTSAEHVHVDDSRRPDRLRLVRAVHAAARLGRGRLRLGRRRHDRWRHDARALGATIIMCNGLLPTYGPAAALTAGEPCEPQLAVPAAITAGVNGAPAATHVHTGALSYAVQ